LSGVAEGGSGHEECAEVWYDYLAELFKSFRGEFWLERSRCDPCVFWGRSADEAFCGAVSIHVDDGRGRGSDAFVEWFQAGMEEQFGEGIEWSRGGKREDFVGVEWGFDDDGTWLSQHKYIENELKEIELSKDRFKQRHALITEEERDHLKSLVGALRWVAKTLCPESHLIHLVTRSAHDQEATVDSLRFANKIVRILKRTCKDCVWFLPRLPPGEIRLLSVTDAGEEPDSVHFDGKWVGGKLLMAQVKGDQSGKVDLLGWKLSKLPRVSHSSFDAETIIAADGVDGAIGVSLFIDEGLFGQKPTLLERREAQCEGWDAMAGRKEFNVQILAQTDAKCLTTRVHALTLDQGMRKARKTDISDLKDGLELGVLEDVDHIAGVWNPADPLTKAASRTAQTMGRLREVVGGMYVAMH